jgi:hypothetical protein
MIVIEAIGQETIISKCQQLATLVSSHTSGKGNGIHATVTKIIKSASSNACRKC